MGTQAKIGNRLESQNRLGKLIADHYQEAREIKESGRKPIVWTTTAAPNEILWAMDFCVLFPEAYAATCGARHAAYRHCKITEDKGYEHHLCTYCRNGLGSTLADIEGLDPFDPLPAPDLLLVANNSCSLITKWWEHLSHYWNVPLIHIDTPYIIPGVPEKDVIGHIKHQIGDLIRFLEEFTGKKFDHDRLREVVKNGSESAKGYTDMMKMNKHNPAPSTYFDLMPHNFPNLVLRYKPEVADHYRLMKQEMNERIREGIVPFENMKYRVYWDGIPYWFAMRFLSKKLQSLGICLVTSAYSQLFAFDRSDPERPLDSVAENTAYFYLNRDVRYKAEYTEQLYRDYDLEAGIFAYAMTCKPFSITMHYIADYVQKKLGVLSTIIEGDLVDDTFFDEEKTGIRLETFAEALESNKPSVGKTVF